MATANSPNYPQIAGVPLRTAAWKSGEWADLYGKGPLRGSDDTIAGTDGESHRAKQRGPLRALIEVRVAGKFDSDGVAHSDEWAGLHANLTELEALFVPGLVTVEIFHDSAVYRTGQGEVVGDMRPQIVAGRFADVIFDVKIHAGILEPPTP